MQLLAYDFEVFKHDWMVVIINIKTKNKTVIINNESQLLEFYKAHIDDIWVGYNSRNYDQYILKGILCGLDPYFVNNEIIINDKKGAQVVKKSNEFPLNNFDISTGFHSLKQLEGFMGSKIKESSVSFNINRKLTDLEIEEVLEYCTHDVEETIKVFNLRKEEFDSQLSLIKAFDLPMEMFNKTKAQLSAYVLGALRTERNDEFNISIPDTLVIGEKYKYIVDWYKNPLNMNYKKSLVTDVAGVPHVFAWGGIHGAVANYTDEGIILCLDVASLYPAIMIEYGYISRNVADPSRYVEIRDTRLKLKAEKNPMQLPFKIVLNSTYGAMKDQYNNLYDPLMANNVCVAGQLLLLDLIEKIEHYCTLIQSNTDGLFLKVEKEEDIDKIKNIAKEWEARTRLDLEWEVFNKIYQKDVNNYIIINEKGKYKSKGAYVKKLSEIDYDLPIVNEALINNFITNKPIEDTINECDDFRKFQKIVKISRLYKHALYGENKIDEKVLRVYASNVENASGVFKVKDVIDNEGVLSTRIEKISNTPKRCFIYNDDVTNCSISNELDKQYYIDIANKRLQEFLDNTKIKKHKLQSEIKFVSDEIRDKLIQLLEEEFVDFIDFLKSAVYIPDITSKHLKILTILNYFSRFGKNKKLLLTIDMFYNLATRKQISFKDIDKLEINEEVLVKYSNKLTKTQYRELDMYSYIREILESIENKPLSIKEQIKLELEYLGYTTYTNDAAGNKFYIVIEFKTSNDTTKPQVKLLHVKTGEIIKSKIKDGRIFRENPFKLFSILKVLEFKQKKKSIMVDGKWTTSEELEDILHSYEVY